MSNQINSAILPDASPDFNDGAAAGYHDCAIDLGLTPETHFTIDTGSHSPDWYAGWLSGYRTRMEEQYG
jgi:hypothetical protein